MRPLAAYLRSLNPELPRPVQTLQLGGLVNFFGSGLAIPFLFIYLHNVRDIGLDTAGLILATNGAAGLVAGPVAGWFVDRVGGRLVLALALVLQAAGYALYPLITEAWHGFGANLLVGVGIGTFWPAQSSLIAGLTPRDQRSTAFAVQRVTMNLGFGLGGLVGGLIATTSDPTTFTVIFLANAATFIGYLGALPFIPAPGRATIAGDAKPGTYRDVLRNRIFMAVITINVLLITGGMAQVGAFPVYGKNEAGLSESAIGLVYFCNALVIVVAQLPVAKLLEGRRRMPAIGLLGVLWAVSWLLLPVAAAFTDGVATVAVFALAASIFGFGACLHGAVHAPLVVDLADSRIIGRYLALSSSSWQIGFIAGPALSGLLLSQWPHGLWLAAAAICLTAGASALALERRVPRDAQRTPLRARQPLAVAPETA